MNWKFWEKLKEEKESVLSLDKYEFPCSSDNCLVRAACTKACEKIEMDDNKLEALFMKYNCCPDCGNTGFMEGPSGGASTNIKCAGCGHCYNMALPLFVQRIHIGKGGRFHR